jgi:hypothetical protein
LPPNSGRSKAIVESIRHRAIAWWARVSHSGAKEASGLPLHRTMTVCGKLSRVDDIED